MIEIKFNKKSNNPFYGLSSCLAVFSNEEITSDMLNDAWAEVKNDHEKKEMFYSLLFSIGDVTNRQHNIFKGKKVDGGGNSNRKNFEVILKWIFDHQPEQFEKFLNAHLFNEYSCFDALFKSRVETKKNSRIISNVSCVFLNKEYSRMLLNYIYSVINGNNPFDKMLVAKFLTIPRLSVRQGHKKMLNDTK